MDYTLGDVIRLGGHRHRDADPARRRRRRQRHPAQEQGLRRRLAAHQLRVGPRGLRRCVRRVQVRRAPQPGGDARPPGQRGRGVRATGVAVDRDVNSSSTSQPSWSAPSLGAVLAFLAYKKHFDEDADPARQARRLLHRPGDPLLRRGTSSPRSSARSCWSSSSSRSATRPPSSGPLAVALLVVGIGASLGGPTGYAINPARDLGPRIAHALLPIPGKGSSDWAYSWVPVVGPLVGGVLAGLAAPSTSSDADSTQPSPSGRRSTPSQRRPGTPDHQKDIHTMADYVLAIDQGTTSTRAIVFDHSGPIVRDRADRARADLPARRLGRARRRRRSGTTPARSSASR